MSLRILIEVWVSFAGTLFEIALIPQILRIIRRKSSNDISIPMYIIFIFGQSQFLFYGIYLKSFSLIFTNSLALLFSFIMIYLVIKYREKLLKFEDKKNKINRSYDMNDGPFMGSSY